MPLDGDVGMRVAVIDAYEVFVVKSKEKSALAVGRNIRTWNIKFLT